MIKQTIIWTVLPHRTDGPPAAGTRLRLSLYAAPRLWNDDPAVTTMKLGSFPDFLDWPDKVKQGTFTIEFEGGPPVAATTDFTKLRSDLWQALFDADTDVIPFVFEDLSGVAVESFPSDVIHGVIKDVYTKAATEPSLGAGKDLPGRDKLAEDPDLVEIARPVNPERPHHDPDADRTPVSIDEPGSGGPGGPGGPGGSGPKGCRPGCLSILLWPFRLIRWLLKRLGIISVLPLLRSKKPKPKTPIRPVSGGAPGTKKEAFADLKSHVKPFNTADPPLPTSAQIKETYDFHRMVSALGDYPLLLRHLGLVVDVEVTVPATVPAAAGTVKAAVNLPLATPTAHHTPRTHYELDAKRFTAAPRPVEPEIAGGLLRLNDTARFQVFQVDVAGGGIKLENTATNTCGLQAINEWPANSPEDVGLPALQTAGISVVRLKTAMQLLEDFLRSYGLNLGLTLVDGSPAGPFGRGGAPPAATDELFAEDLVRGYRVDIHDDKANKWHSLCRRVGDYRFLDAPGGPVDLDDLEDEGFVQASATEPMPGTQTRVLRVHDSLFTWDGWSLAAPRPGMAILPDHKFGTPANDAVTDFGLETGFEAKEKSLPRLRFGYKYRVRMRVADLAGNSVFDPDDPDFADTPPEATSEFEFLRFEPVAPPPLMLRAVPVEGESLEHIVVRSSVDDPPETVTAQSSERHIVPPKVSQLMAERQRRFDGPAAMNQDQPAYDLASREAGSMTHKLNLTTGKLDQIDGVVKEGTADRTIWLQTKDQFELSYLPDPYARGVVLLGLPGMASFEEIVEPAAGPVNKLPFDGAWPNRQAVRLRLEGLPAGAPAEKPKWDAAGRVLTVKLQQGERRDVRVSCYFSAKDLDKMAIWGWTKEASPPDLPNLRDRSTAGRNWLMLPYRTLALVHAVQQPLKIPEFSNLVNPAPKVLGDTTAKVSGQVAVDAKSTGKLEVRASWVDPVDDLSKPSFDPAVTVANELQVDEILLNDPADDSVTVELVHAIGDTNYHKVTYTPSATTRFREYFPPAVLADPQNLVRPRSTEAPVTRTIDIPNSARPAAPRPLYALPTWRWVTGSSGSVVNHVRHGNGIRIYMERPWFSSGDGELLGIVIRPPGQDVTGPAAETIRKYTSEWAQDPIRQATPTGLLELGDLVDPVEVMQNVTIDELNSPVHVAGFRPEYDKDRNLWFCDLTLKSDRNYFPFVRLAVARFQPISVPNAHLSRVVLLDWAQVVPTRSVQYDLSQADNVAVQVGGPAYRFPVGQEFSSSVMRARVESREIENQKDELGWKVEEVRDLEVTPGSSTDETTWEGNLQVPATPGAKRVTVLEIESFGDAGFKVTSVMVQIQKPSGSEPSPPEGGRTPQGEPGTQSVTSTSTGKNGEPAQAEDGLPQERIAFADALELP